MQRLHKLGSSAGELLRRVKSIGTEREEMPRSFWF